MPRFPNNNNHIINTSIQNQNPNQSNSMDIDSDNDNNDNQIESQNTPQINEDELPIDFNVDNIINEVIIDPNQHQYIPEIYKLCFIPQDEISRKVYEIALKCFLIKIKEKTILKFKSKTSSKEVYIVNKKWYKKWKEYSRYGTLTRIIKNYDLYQSKPIKYTQEEKKNPGIINNSELLIRYKINSNDGRNILVSKNSLALDTRFNHVKKNKNDDVVFMIPEKFKLINEYFKCDHILKAELWVDRDSKTYEAFYVHLNLVFIPTLESFMNLDENNENNLNEFIKKHNIIYDVYFKQNATSKDVMQELCFILKEKPELLVNMGVKFLTNTNNEDELMNHLNYLTLYYPQNINHKNLQEMLDFIYNKETIENLKKDKKISLDDIRIKKMNLYNNRLDTIYQYNWMSEKTNLDHVDNGYIFVEYLPNENPKEVSIFEEQKIEMHHEQRARRENDDDMDIDHSINNHHPHHYKKDYNLEDQPLDEKNNKNGLVGLNNLGNTCYMNTGLQCLSNCELLSKYFLTKIYKKFINIDNPIGSKGEIVEKYSQLIHHLWYGNREYISPIQFKQSFGKVYQAFNDYRQQDTQEFISYLLDSLHEDLNKVLKKPYIETKDLNNELSDEEMFKIKRDLYLCRNQSFISDIFYGFYKSTVFCPDESCKNISKSFEVFNMITLPLINEAEIRKIDEFKEEEYKKKGIKEIKCYFIPFKINYKPFYFTVRIKKEMEIQEFKKKIEIITGFNCNTFEIYKIQNNEYICVKNDIKLLEDFIKNEKIIYLMQIPPFAFGKELNFFDRFYDKLNSNMDKFFLEEEKYEGNDIYDIYNAGEKNADNNNENNINNSENINIIINNNDNNENKEDKIIINEENKDKNKNEEDKIDENTQINIEINNQRNPDPETGANPQKEHNSITKSDTKDEKSTAINDLNINNNYNNNDDIEMVDETDNFDLDKNEWIKAELYNYTYKLNREKNEVEEEYVARPRIIYINKNWNNAQIYDCILMMLEGARNDLPEIKEMWFKDLKEITANLKPLDQYTSFEQFDELNTHPLMLQYLKYYNYNKEKENNDDITKKKEKYENSIFIYDNEEYQIKNILDEAEKEGNSLNDTEILFKVIWKPAFSNDYKEGIEPIIIEKSEKLDEIFKRIREEEYLEKKGLKKAIGGEDTSNKQGGITRKNLKNLNLEEILNNFNQIEKLSKDNEWFCPKCKKHQLADKKMEIYYVSEIVILHLKRFRNNRKIETLVDFPIENLDLTKFLPQKKDTKYIYDLFAVANHIGGLQGGHYYAYCKNCKDNEWYEFNDSSVDKIDKNKIVTENAYVLFYKKRRNDNEKINEDELFNKPFIEIDKDKLLGNFVN